MNKDLQTGAAASILKHRGCLTYVAEELGIPYKQLAEAVATDKTLQDALRQSREQIVDIAQQTMVDAAAEGSVKAAHYLLKTLGRERGFGEDAQVQINVLTPQEQTDRIRDIFGLPRLPP